MPPVTTSVYCIISLCLQYFLVFTGLMIVRTIREFFPETLLWMDANLGFFNVSMFFKNLQTLLETGTKQVVVYCPMLAILFLSVRLKADLVNTPTVPSESPINVLPLFPTRICMYTATYAVFLQLLLLLLTPGLVHGDWWLQKKESLPGVDQFGSPLIHSNGAGNGMNDSSDGNDSDLYETPVDDVSPSQTQQSESSKLLPRLIKSLKYLFMTLLYIGAIGTIMGCMSLNTYPKSSTSISCVCFLTYLFFFTHTSLACVRNLEKSIKGVIKKGYEIMESVKEKLPEAVPKSYEELRQSLPEKVGEFMDKTFGSDADADTVGSKIRNSGNRIKNKTEAFTSNLEKLQVSLTIACYQGPLALAPMLAILFIAARLRLMAINESTLEIISMPLWVIICFYLCTICVFIQVISAVVMPFVVSGCRVEKGECEGDVRFVIEDQAVDRSESNQANCNSSDNSDSKTSNNSWQPFLQSFLYYSRYTTIITLYTSFILICIGLHYHPGPNNSYAPQPSSTLLCVLNLCYQYFIVHLLLFIFQQLNHTKLILACNSAKSSLIYAPMLCCLFLAIRFRALQLSISKETQLIPLQAGPQLYVQDAMFLSCFTIFFQWILGAVLSLYYGENGSDYEIDSEGNPIVRVKKENHNGTTTGSGGKNTITDTNKTINSDRSSSDSPLTSGFFTVGTFTTPRSLFPTTLSPSSDKSYLPIVLTAIRYLFLITMYTGLVSMLYGLVNMTPGEIQPYKVKGNGLIPGMENGLPKPMITSMLEMEVINTDRDMELLRDMPELLKWGENEVGEGVRELINRTGRSVNSESHNSDSGNSDSINVSIEKPLPTGQNHNVLIQYDRKLDENTDADISHKSSLLGYRSETEAG